MSMKPKISVIVPVYKTEPYLRQCLDSIVGQTYQNMQIILVDDGSPDNCGAICDEYARKDERIMVAHQENQGVAAARNAGLALADGEYLGFVDSDDWIEPDMYEYLSEDISDLEIDVVQCGIWLECLKYSKPLFVSDKDICCYGGIDGFSMADWRRLSNQIYNKLYRANVVKDIWFDGQYPIGEDLDFNLRVLQKAENILFVKEAKYHYWQRENSLCHKVMDRHGLVSLRSVLLPALDDFKDKNVAKSFFQEMILRDDLDICYKLAGYKVEGGETLRREIQAELKQYLREILFKLGFSFKERIKVCLIVYLWPLYRLIIRYGRHL